MKPIREDKSDKKEEREDRVMIIIKESGKEMTIDKMVDLYLNKHDDDKKMNYGIMSAVLKSMNDQGLITKEWKHIKENKNGRIQSKNVIYYKVKIQPVVETDKEITPVVPKIDEQPKKDEPKKKSIIDLLTSLSFDEALGKVYRGSKIISAVSGNIYAMIPGKGITSTSNPGAIVTSFSSLEMEGTWRVLESPKGCPFCGYPVKLNHETLGEKAYYYVCTNHSCMAHGPRTLTAEQAVLKFNERV